MEHFVRRMSRLLLCAALSGSALPVHAAPENEKTDLRLAVFARQHALTHAFEQHAPPAALHLAETDPVHDLIDALRLMDKDAAAAESRIASVSERLFESVTVAVSGLSAYRRESAQKDLAMVEQLQAWAANASLSTEAKALRNLIVALRLTSMTTASGSYDRNGVSLQFGGNLLQNPTWVHGGRYGYESLPLRLPCELVVRHPGAAIEAFADAGDWPAAVALTSFLDCPIPQMFSGFPDARDFVVAANLFGGKLGHGDIERMIPVRNKPRIQPRSYIEPEKPTGPPATDWSVADARRWMSHDVPKAVRVLSASDRPEDRLTLALAKHAFVPDIEERKAAVSPLLAELEAGIDAGSLDRTAKRLLPPDGDYDGSDESMVEHLRYIATLGGFAPYGVPCDVLVKSPALLRSLDSVFGGGRDNQLPQADCPPDQFSLPGSYRQYLSAIRRPLSGWEGQLGSIRTVYGRRDQKLELMARAFPRELSKRERPTSLPFEAWSMISLANRKIFNGIAAIYETAHKELSDYYQERFGLTAAEAEHAAAVAMHEPVYNGNWGSAPRRSLRAMILNDATAEDISERIEEAGDIARLANEPIEMAGFYEWAWTNPKLPEPLIMISVHRPEVVRLLLDAPNSTLKRPPSWGGYSKENLRTDIEATNWFGKTALMTAAQVDNLESVKLLLDKGADTRTTTLVADAREVSGDHLVHDLRTAAMYAAANSSAELIRLLLQADAAAFDSADSTGLRPIHYLLGYVDLEVNKELSGDEILVVANEINTFADKERAIDYPASFDCNKAATWDEKTVCQSQLLRVQDTILSRLYENASNTLPDKGRQALLESQRAWLTIRRRCDKEENAEACVERAYTRRIEALRGLRENAT